MQERLVAHVKRWLVGAPVGTVRYWLTLVTVVSRLGANRRARVTLRLLGVLMPIRDRLGMVRAVTIPISYGGVKLPWTIGPRSDLDVLNEVLVLGVYRDLPSEARMILDIGSHIGASILFFRVRFPDALIVGFEPDPSTWTRLRANVGHLRNVQIRQVAVTVGDGPVAFFAAKQSWVSSLEAADGRESLMVEGQGFDRLIREFGNVDLIKLDIEGAERDLVTHSAALREVGAIVGEYHDSSDARDRQEFFGRLSRYELRVSGAPGSVTHFSALRTA